MADSQLTHRADDYARAVGSGAIIAGPYVRLACERHLRDRARAAADPTWYQFREVRADHAVTFIEKCLRLPDMLDEDGDPMPFTLMGWQAFIVSSLFGWVDASGYRRFREAYIETGKGSGKTPLLGAIGLYGLTMDGERAAEIYAAASDSDQAMIMFRDAVRIAKASPDVLEELAFSGGDHIWQIAHPESLSFFKTFSRESGAKSGTRPHMGLIDELHEQAPQISIKVRAGAKRRRQPLFIEITNSGFDRTSICWQRHEHARQVVEGTIEDEQFFGYVCALDKDEDPLEDESCWLKANPSLGVCITEDYLRRQVQNAKNIPAETNTVLRLNFCVWTNAVTRYFDMTKWADCQPAVSDDELAGLPCYGGVDLGQSDDLSSFARIWPLEDGRVAVKMRYWIPRGALEKHPDRPYAEWERSGLLTVTEGDTSDLDVIEQDVLDLCRESGVRELAYDKRFAQQMALHWQGAGLDVVDVAQGFALNEPLRGVGAWVVDGVLCHGADPILAWMASNTVVREGRNKEIRMDKEKSSEKIDGVSALVMAADRVVRQPVHTAPTFEWV